MPDRRDPSGFQRSTHLFSTKAPQNSATIQAVGTQDFVRRQWPAATIVAAFDAQLVRFQQKLSQIPLRSERRVPAAGSL